MATHRRGLRPSQWPVRDLLGDQRSRLGGLGDPRLLAAVSGLLACGAAATVALTAGDARTAADTGDRPVPGPMALPAPDTVVRAPDPAPVPDADTVPDAVPDRVTPPRRDPSLNMPKTWHAPARKRAAPPPHPAAGHEQRGPTRTIADRVAAELARMEHSSSRSAHRGVPGVPVQRADAAALREPAHSEARSAGRHRAPDVECDDERGDKAERGGKAEHDRDKGDRGRDRDKRDQDKHDRKKHDRDKGDQDKGDQDKHDRNKGDRDKHDRHDHDHAKHDRDKGDRDKGDRDKHDRKKHDRDEHDRDHDRTGRHHGDRHHGDRHHGDRHHADRDDTDAADPGDDAPAMAVLVTDREHGSRLATHTIDPDALLAALSQLHGSD